MYGAASRTSISWPSAGSETEPVAAGFVGSPMSFSAKPVCTSSESRYLTRSTALSGALSATAQASPPPSCASGSPAPPSTAGNGNQPVFSPRRSEEHTSELQSRQYLVCRLLLEKKKRNKTLLNFIHTKYS